LLHSASVHFEDRRNGDQEVQYQDLEVRFLLGELSHAAEMYASLSIRSRKYLEGLSGGSYKNVGLMLWIEI
jgi:hypothetical protein